MTSVVSSENRRMFQHIEIDAMPEDGMSKLNTLTVRLRQLRKKTKQTQSQVADAVGIARSTLASWEGGSDTPSREGLIALADFYGASLDWIEARTGKINTHEFGHFVDEPDVLFMLSLWSEMSEDSRIHTLELMKTLAAAGRRNIS